MNSKIICDGDTRTLNNIIQYVSIICLQIKKINLRCFDVWFNLTSHGLDFISRKLSIGVFPKWNRNSAHSDNLVNH